MFGEIRFADSVNIINPAMLILELRNVIHFGRRDEYLILSFVYKFAPYVYSAYKINESIINKNYA